MPRLFDTYIMVDWSAASTPRTGKDSIWIAELSAETGRIRYNNPATRTDAYQKLTSRLTKLTASDARVLVGFDFSLGYPAGTAKALGLKGEPWAAVHKLLTDTITDDETNANNRFDIAHQMNARMSGRSFPFWGVTSLKYAGDNLSAKKPDYTGNDISEYRVVEQFLRAESLGVPKSMWQLAYIGSVGSQSLMGIPYVSKLRRQFPSSKVWPFETGFQSLSSQSLKSTQIVIAEIYPSLLKAVPKSGEPIDKAQVRTIAHHYWGMDETGSIGAAFAPPNSLNAENLSLINKEEGWILGITPINIGHLAS